MVRTRLDPVRATGEGVEQDARQPPNLRHRLRQGRRRSETQHSDAVAAFACVRRCLRALGFLTVKSGGGMTSP